MTDTTAASDSRDTGTTPATSPSFVPSNDNSSGYDKDDNKSQDTRAFHNRNDGFHMHRCPLCGSDYRCGLPGCASGRFFLSNAGCPCTVDPGLEDS